MNLNLNGIIPGKIKIHFKKTVIPQQHKSNLVKSMLQAMQLTMYANRRVTIMCIKDHCYVQGCFEVMDLHGRNIDKMIGPIATNSALIKQHG